MPDFAESPELLRRAERIERGNGNSWGDRAFRRSLFVLQRIHEQVNSLRGVRLAVNRRAQQAAAHPCLAGLRQAVNADERSAQQSLALDLAGNFLKSLARTHS